MIKQKRKLCNNCNTEQLIRNQKKDWCLIKLIVNLEKSLWKLIQYAKQLYPVVMEHQRMYITKMQEVIEVNTI